MPQSHRLVAFGFLVRTRDPAAEAGDLCNRTQAYRHHAFMRTGLLVFSTLILACTDTGSHPDGGSQSDAAPDAGPVSDAYAPDFPPDADPTGGWQAAGEVLVIYNGDEQLCQPTGGIEIDASHFEGAFLVASVTYTGCGLQEFRICWGQPWAPSCPPSTGMVLQHRTETSCQHSQTAELRIDLSVLANLRTSSCSACQHGPTVSLADGLTTGGGGTWPCE